MARVALLTKPNKKQVQYDIKQGDADHALKAWPNSDCRNCNEPTLCCSKSFKYALNDQVTGNIASPLFCLGRIIQ